MTVAAGIRIGLVLIPWALAELATGYELLGPIALAERLYAVIAALTTSPSVGDEAVVVQLCVSLLRALHGFALGVAIGLPVGCLLGAVPAIRRWTDPFTQLLRRVPPPAWFPLSLALFSSTSSQTAFLICITSVWPIIVHTEGAVSSLPARYRLVAASFRFSLRRYLTRVLLPYSLPTVIAGMRLALGVAWVATIAGESLAGEASGIGRVLRDSWHQSRFDHVLAAIFLVGWVGFIFDMAMQRLERHFAYGG